jgi:hypothetical protein
MVVTYEPSKHITEFVSDFRKCWTLFGILVILESDLESTLQTLLVIVIYCGY